MRAPSCIAAASACWGLFPSKYGQDAKELPQAVSPGGNFFNMRNRHCSFCQLPMKLHSDRSQLLCRAICSWSFEKIDNQCLPRFPWSGHLFLARCHSLEHASLHSGSSSEKQTQKTKGICERPFTRGKTSCVDPHQEGKTTCSSM